MLLGAESVALRVTRMARRATEAEIGAVVFNPRQSRLASVTPRTDSRNFAGGPLAPSSAENKSFSIPSPLVDLTTVTQRLGSMVR